jgi:hypothetical protein
VFIIVFSFSFTSSLRIQNRSVIWRFVGSAIVIFIIVGSDILLARSESMAVTSFFYFLFLWGIQLYQLTSQILQSFNYTTKYTHI